MLRRRRSGARKFRAEGFGAIVQLETPRALVFVDREYARGLGSDGEGRWNGDGDGEIGAGVLSAPLEAHLQLTNRCDAGCAGCYTGATPTGAAGEWGLEEWKRAVDALADAGVFHLALGGGESAQLEWLPEIAAYARGRGLIPNLTTSGLVGVERLVGCAELFGQINVSIDGVGDAYAAVRGFDGFARADAGVQALRKVKKEVGINCVVTRANFDGLGEVFAYAKRRRLNEVELLRFKPSGRGIAAYAGLSCSQVQHRAFLPMVLGLTKQHRMRVRVDCSYTPMLAWHEPGAELMARLAVYGCVGGDFLIGAKASGVMSACSFAAPPEGKPRVDGIGEYWGSEGAFGAFRTWQAAEEPCASCAYHALCRGGCKVVTAHVDGDVRRPDPECPKVVEWRARTGDSARRSDALRVV